MNTNSNEGTTFTFKTNINCSGCVARVTPALDEAGGICHWSVDTTGKDKILTVHSEGISQPEIIETVKKAGFTIEPINN
jgi:copper chaperone CopZ